MKKSKEKELINIFETIPEKIPAKKARDNFSEMINQVSYQDKNYILTKNGRRYAVVISINQYELFKDYLKNTKENLRQIILDHVESGEIKTISIDEMKKILDTKDG